VIHTLASLRARRDEERGFTLIELMVVVLIIAILIAIAIPTFLGARQRAQDRAAQSSLRNALAAAKTLYTDNEDYGAASVANLEDTEPSLNFTTSASGGPNEVSVASDNLDADPALEVIRLAAESRSGRCFAMMDVAQEVTGEPSPGTYYARVDGDCEPPARGAASWTSNW
jgi:type IV pilus assembly protein PilA